MSNRKGPLARFRVLDLTRARAGPTAARMLADWGAETGAFDEIGKQKHRLKSRQVFVKFLRDWFDGFRTLKFVHYMRDNHYPSQPIGWICKQDIDLGVSTVSDASDLRIILSKLGCPPASVPPEHKITTRK